VDESLQAGAARRTINPPLGLAIDLCPVDTQLPQFHPRQVVALRPGSEQRALDATVALIDQFI